MGQNDWRFIKNRLPMPEEFVSPGAVPPPPLFGVKLTKTGGVLGPPTTWTYTVKTDAGVTLATGLVAVNTRLNWMPYTYAGQEGAWKAGSTDPWPTSDEGVAWYDEDGFLQVYALGEVAIDGPMGGVVQANGVRDSDNGVWTLEAADRLAKFISHVIVRPCPLGGGAATGTTDFIVKVTADPVNANSGYGDIEDGAVIAWVGVEPTEQVPNTAVGTYFQGQIVEHAGVQGAGQNAFFWATIAATPPGEGRFDGGWYLFAEIGGPRTGYCKSGPEEFTDGGPGMQTLHGGAVVAVVEMLHADWEGDYTPRQFYSPYGEEDWFDGAPLPNWYRTWCGYSRQD